MLHTQALLSETQNAISNTVANADCHRHYRPAILSKTQIAISIVEYKTENHKLKIV